MSKIVLDLTKPLPNVEVFLTTVPPVTPDNGTRPVLGQWICYSPYIGKSLIGVYYLKRVTSVECHTEEDGWLGVCGVDRSPYAFFFDTSDDTKGLGIPFMFLDHFYINAGTGSQGQGKFLEFRGPGWEKQGFILSPVWSYIDWKQVS